MSFPVIPSSSAVRVLVRTTSDSCVTVGPSMGGGRSAALLAIVGLRQYQTLDSVASRQCFDISFLVIRIACIDWHPSPAVGEQPRRKSLTSKALAIRVGHVLKIDDDLIGVAAGRFIERFGVQRVHQQPASRNCIR